MTWLRLLIAFGLCSCADSAADHRDEQPTSAGRAAGAGGAGRTAGAGAAGRAAGAGGQQSAPQDGSVGRSVDGAVDASVAGSAPDAHVARDAGCLENCSEPIELAPELLMTWVFPWTGGNISLFQIALCEDGAAVFVYARNPQATDVTRIEGTYVALDARHAVVTFQGSLPELTPSDLIFELEYDDARQRVIRSGDDDGYSTEGYRVSEVQLLTMPATCAEP